MENNFVPLLKYSEIDEEQQWDLERAIDLIQQYKHNNNSKLFNNIDYELLYFLETRYQENEIFSKNLQELKNIIANNWVTKQQLFARLILHAKQGDDI